jgi:hypothetical protein
LYARSRASSPTAWCWMTLSPVAVTPAPVSQSRLLLNQQLSSHSSTSSQPCLVPQTVSCVRLSPTLKPATVRLERCLWGLSNHDAQHCSDAPCDDVPSTPDSHGFFVAHSRDSPHGHRYRLLAGFITTAGLGLFSCVVSSGPAACARQRARLTSYQVRFLLPTADMELAAQKHTRSCH